MKVDSSYFRTSVAEARESLLGELNALPEALSRAADLLIGALRMGRKVLTCGNGGSAGDAQHIASELVNRFETERMALATVSLVPDSSVVTAIANDYSYEVLFERQVEALGREGDVLMAFSTSGESRNVVLAVAAAQRRKMHVLALTGRTGGAVARQLGPFDVEIRADAQETARIQEVHLMAIHLLCKAIDVHFVGNSLKIPEKIQRDELALAELTRGQRPLVFTTGVFDVLSAGHVKYLKAARELGACLVVGVHSDASAARLCDEKREPIQHDEDRAAILAALGCVDFVTIFHEPTPEALIAALQPDVFVKEDGGEGAAVVGEAAIRHVAGAFER